MEIVSAILVIFSAVVLILNTMYPRWSGQYSQHIQLVGNPRGFDYGALCNTLPCTRHT